MQLGDRRTFADAELDATVADQVEGRDPLGHSGGMVRRQLHDAVTEADVLGALAGRREEDLGSGRVRVLLEEVVLDLPRVVVAKLVGQLDLVERVLHELVFAARAPRLRELQLIENAELHGVVPPTGLGSFGSPRTSSPMMFFWISLVPPPRRAPGAPVMPRLTSFSSMATAPACRPRAMAVCTLSSVMPSLSSDDAALACGPCRPPKASKARPVA